MKPNKTDIFVSLYLGLVLFLAGSIVAASKTAASQKQMSGQQNINVVLAEDQAGRCAALQ